MTTFQKLVSRITPLFILLSSVFFSSLLYDSFQLPKAAGLAAALLFCLPFLFFTGFYGLPSVPAVLAFSMSLYFPLLLLFSGNHPPLYFGLMLFSPLCFFVFYSGRFSRNSVSALLNLLFFAAACYGLYQFIFLKISRPYSFFGNPIFFAEFCGSLLPVLIYGLIRGSRLKFLSFINLILAPLILIICSSRGAMVSAFVSLFLMLAFMYSAKIKIFPSKKYAAVLISAALCAVFFIPGSYNSLKTAAARIASVSSFSSPEIRHRAILAETSFGIFMESPLLGMKPGAVRQIHQQKQAKLLADNPGLQFVNSSYTHNDYLQLLAETGAVGLLLFLCFIFSSVFSFERASPLMSGDTYIFGAAAVSASLFFISEAFFNFPLFSFPSAVLFYSFCGMMVSSAADTSDKQKKLPVPAAITASAIMLALLITYLVKDKPGAFAANFYLITPAQEQPFDISSLTKAASLEPDNFYAVFNRGQAALDAGRQKEAFYYFQNLLAFFPNSADVQYDAGYALMLDKNYNEAVSYYENALFLYPSFSAACRGMYSSLMSQGREKEALTYLERAVKSDAEAGIDYLKDKGVILQQTP